MLSVVIMAIALVLQSVIALEPFTGYINHHMNHHLLVLIDFSTSLTQMNTGWFVSTSKISLGWELSCSNDKTQRHGLQHKRYMEEEWKTLSTKKSTKDWLKSVAKGSTKRAALLKIWGILIRTVGITENIICFGVGV